jgi:hypothetical protein
LASVAVVVDPRVSKTKFEREVAAWRMQAMEYGRRGIWIVEASYPKVLAVFASPVLQPHAVLFGAELDFTNYDLEPPSVTLLIRFPANHAYRRRPQCSYV